MGARKEIKKKSKEIFSSRWYPEGFKSLAKEAGVVESYSKKISKYQGVPVVVVGNERTGVPYTWTIDDWQEQAKKQLSNEQFQKFMVDFRKERMRLKEDLAAAHSASQKWMDAGLLKSMVLVVSRRFPSSGDSEITGLEWRNFERERKALFKRNPTFIIVDASHMKSKSDPRAFRYLSRNFEALKKEFHYLYPRRFIRTRTKKRMILLNPTSRRNKLPAWHDDDELIVGISPWIKKSRNKLDGSIELHNQRARRIVRREARRMRGA